MLPRECRVGGFAHGWNVGFGLSKERPKGVSDGQQVDIPVLEYIVMEGRSRLTKPDDWKCLAKQ